jgi:L-amino acid N-acyltransferase YncA
MEIQIRQARPEDSQSIAGIYEEYVVKLPTSFEETPPIAEEMESRIRETLEQFPYLVAEEAGRVVAYAYAGPHSGRASYRWSVNVSVYISPTHHRRGIGTLLYRELLALLEAQGYAMALAGITLPNAASVGLHESLGFTLVGIYHDVGFKLDAWRDVGWWERRLMKLSPAPAEPMPWKLMPAYHFGEKR